jgi:RNA polymerase sigma-70 factor (ECF subfamily)
LALSDIDLVMLAKAGGDDTAFAELVRRHQAGLRTFLRKFLTDATQADDIGQEALIKAYHGISGFRGGASFRSWLYAIAWRELLQEKRKEKAAHRLTDALSSETKTGDGAAAPESGATLDLHRALSGLGAVERAALLLCDAAGFSHGEAAAALGAPLGTVKSHVSRAREKVRTAMNAVTDLETA